MICSTLKFLKRKDNAIDLKNLDDLIEYFVQIVPKSSAKFFNKKSSYNIRYNEKNDGIHQTNELLATNVLPKLKIKKSTGHDEISNEILKCCSPNIECHLARAIIYCLRDCFFQDSSKIAKILPL